MKVSCLALTISTLIILCNLGAGAQDLGEWTAGLADYPINKSELHGAEIDGKFYLVGGQCDCAGGGASLEMFIYNVIADSCPSCLPPATYILFPMTPALKCSRAPFIGSFVSHVLVVGEYS